MTEPNLRFLWFSPKIFGFLRFPALQMLEFPGEGVNPRKSAVFCEDLRFGLSLSPEFRHLKHAPKLGTSIARQQQLLPSSLGPVDATSIVPCPMWQREVRQHKCNGDVASDFCLSVVVVALGLVLINVSQRLSAPKPRIASR